MTRDWNGYFSTISATQTTLAWSAPSLRASALFSRRCSRNNTWSSLTDSSSNNNSSNSNSCFRTTPTKNSCFTRRSFKTTKNPSRFNSVSEKVWSYHCKHFSTKDDSTLSLGFKVDLKNNFVACLQLEIFACCVPTFSTYNLELAWCSGPEP